MRRLGAGVAGGLLGGALVGALEAVVVWRSGVAGGAPPPAGWALLAYGAVGAALGFPLGALAHALRTGAFGLTLGVVGGGLAFLVGRGRWLRDATPALASGLLPVLAQLGMLALLGAAAVAVWRTLAGADERHGALTRPGLVGLLVAVLGIGWSLAVRFVPVERSAPVPTGAPAPAGAPNVMLVVVDALRADRLSSGGAAAVPTPHLDALAADGIVFRRTFAQASWTRASIGSIFTGLYPSSHGAIRHTDVLPARVETVAEVLAKGGYYTAGFANDVDIAPAFGFDQGFAEYHYLAPERSFWADEAATDLTLYRALRVVCARFLARRVDVDRYYRPAEEVVGHAQRWLDGPGAARPFFLFVHFMDPHEPYMAHPFDGVGYARVAMPNPPASMADTLRAAYDGEVAYLDAQLGALVADLRRRGLYDRTLVVVTADHGEELHDHGGWWHGTTLYDEQIAVPLIVKPPRGGATGRVVDELTTSLDVAPTILRAVGLAPPLAMQGHVLPVDAASPQARDSVYAEENFSGDVLAAVRSKTWKFITANPGNPRGLPPEELFDVAADPGETRNLAATEPARREQMRAALGRGTLEAKAQVGAGAQTDIDAAMQGRLEALGYIEKAPEKKAP